MHAFLHRYRRLVILALVCLVTVVVTAVLWEVPLALYGDSPWHVIRERQLWNCYVSPLGLACVSLLAAAGLAGGWRAARCFRQRKWWWTLVVALVGLDFVLGNWCFWTWDFTHEMLRWGAYCYLQVMGINLLASNVPALLIILGYRPWKLVPQAGLAQTVALYVGILASNYILASLFYVTSFTRVGIE